MHSLKLNQIYRHASTIIPKEVNFFAKINHEWWNKEGTLRLLLKMNLVRVPIIQEFLTNAGLAHIAYSETQTPLRGLKILDVGCGGGLLSEPLAKLGAVVTGIDAGKSLLDVAKSHMKLDASLQDHLKYELSTIEGFSSLHYNMFDVVISSEVIEHVNNPEMFVKHCVECLKPGGSIILTTMDRTLPGRFLNITFNEHIYKIMPKGTHNYEQFIRPSEMKKMLKTNGCRTVGVQGFTMNPFTEIFFRIPVTWFNYALHGIKAGRIFRQGNECKYAAISNVGKIEH